jgi:hypothetical protein
MLQKNVLSDVQGRFGAYTIKYSKHAPTRSARVLFICQNPLSSQEERGGPRSYSRK